MVKTITDRLYRASHIMRGGPDQVNYCFFLITISLRIQTLALASGINEKIQALSADSAAAVTTFPPYGFVDFSGIATLFSSRFGIQTNKRRGQKTKTLNFQTNSNVAQLFVRKNNCNCDPVMLWSTLPTPVHGCRLLSATSTRPLTFATLCSSQIQLLLDPHLHQLYPHVAQSLQVPGLAPADDGA